MPPVRIKYYGLIPMTKRGYLIALGLSALVAVAVVIVALSLGLLPPLDTMWSKEHHLRRSGIWPLFHNYMWWIIVACLVAQAVDTCLTLRAFRKKEAEQPNEPPA